MHVCTYQMCIHVPGIIRSRLEPVKLSCGAPFDEMRRLSCRSRRPIGVGPSSSVLGRIPPAHLSLETGRLAGHCRDRPLIGAGIVQAVGGALSCSHARESLVERVASRRGAEWVEGWVQGKCIAEMALAIKGSVQREFDHPEVVQQLGILGAE